MIGSAGALPRCKQVRHTLPPLLSTFPGKRTASNRIGIGTTRILPRVSLLRGRPVPTAGYFTSCLAELARLRFEVGMVFTMTISAKALRTVLIAMDHSGCAQVFR